MWSWYQSPAAEYVSDISEFVRSVTTVDLARHTQFKRRTERDPVRCKMYLLSSITTKRIRLALEFKKEIIDGSNRSEVTWVLSNSGQ